MARIIITAATVALLGAGLAGCASTAPPPQTQSIKRSVRPLAQPVVVPAAEDPRVVGDQHRRLACLKRHQAYQQLGRSEEDLAAKRIEDAKCAPYLSQ